MRIIAISFLIVILIFTAIPLLYMFGPEPAKNIAEQYLKTLKLLPYAKKYLKTSSSDKKNTLMINNEKFIVWKDLKGNEHFVTSMDDVPEQFRHTVTEIQSDDLNTNFDLMTPEEEGKLINKFSGAPPPENIKNAQHQIIIYTYKANEELNNETTGYFDKFNLKYRILYVEESKENAIQLKSKLGLDLNQTYSNINYPVIEIDGELIERIVDAKDKNGNVIKTSLDTSAINKIFGLRATFE
ncbi:MAG: hypothetical protein ACD_79C00466G0005 [uncultured bacterium]|nr:MAG: hypothetical protein ACD_79C00466G0005 [uncultured bacterium]